VIFDVRSPLLVGVKPGRPGLDAPGDGWLIIVWVAMTGVSLLTGRISPVTSVAAISSLQVVG
jgi:hypothetical protein